MEVQRFAGQKQEIGTDVVAASRGQQILVSVQDSTGAEKTAVLKADAADALGRDLINRAALARAQR